MKTINLLLLAALLSIANFTFAQLSKTNTTTFNTAHQMLLANELNESGEPFAEALGYNLDNLDPLVPNSPDSMSYTFGIENYEYSRYLLQALGAQSGMGLHLMWSPMIEQMASMQGPSFDGTFTGGMQNGRKEDDMLMMMMGMFSMHANQAAPAGAFPQFADFVSGNMNLPQAVDANFQMDFSSARWDRSLMDKKLNPAAMGQSLMKQYLWAQDMLGAFHDSLDNTIDADGVVSPDSIGSPNFNKEPTNNVFYGGNNLDGFMGQMLTGVGINKTMFLINRMAYDGNTLGSVDPATYDPANGIKYFPHLIEVTETDMGTMLPPMLNTMTLVDARSILFDQLSFLWGTTGFKNMADPNIVDAQHYAYRHVFDGSPFPASMSQTGTAGPFDLMNGTSMVLFKNIMAMHYNSANKTLVDAANLSSGNVVQGDVISAQTAGYALVILADFATEFAATPLKATADVVIAEQADFILANFGDVNGGFFNSFTLGVGASNSPKTLEAQASLVRGLYAAYSYTNNTLYLTAANNAYNYMIANFYVPSIHAFKTEFGNNIAAYNPNVMAVLVGALREAKLVGNQTDAPIILSRIGASIIDKMILSESMQSGEVGNDSDNDGIPNIVGGTSPYVFAAEGEYDFSGLSTSLTNFSANNSKLLVYADNNNNTIQVHLNVEQAGNVKTTLYDSNARVVFEKTVHATNGNNSFSVGSNLSNSALYFIRVELDGQLIGTQKLLVQ
ncbi:MAG: hypothetical protein AUK44_00970 [Porphyromonadaceae bacterium CG2_30_38_12]|nr:MAG: hypothetical protein AUK44_00970 [Porphyromonadaceae bacterium CG2_30_38_12]